MQRPVQDLKTQTYEHPAPDEGLVEVKDQSGCLLNALDYILYNIAPIDLFQHGASKYISFTKGIADGGCAYSKLPQSRIGHAILLLEAIVLVPHVPVRAVGQLYEKQDHKGQEQHLQHKAVVEEYDGDQQDTSRDQRNEPERKVERDPPLG
jgi:hypothetical protein